MSVRIPSPIKSTGRFLLGSWADWWFEELGELLNRWTVERETRSYPGYSDNLQRLAALKNKHQGERCFIIGNGPSLNRTDLTLLKNEVTFGLNRIYLLFDKMGFATTYHVAVNELVIKQCADEIASLPCPRFLSWRCRDVLGPAPDIMHVVSRQDRLFYPDITRGVWEGATVTYVAMQIAFHMGFQTVVLVGVDHAFTTAGKPHTTVVSTGDDPNHFDPNYFGKGFRWQLPDLETSEMAYRIAKRNFETCNREILDATIGGKLQVFPKVDYYELLR